MVNFIFVAMGGAVGAMLIGFVVGMASIRQETSQHLILFLKVGVCGGFATFSTFSLEAMRLFEQNKIGMGIVYIVASVVCSIAGVLVGQGIAQKV